MTTNDSDPFLDPLEKNERDRSNLVRELVQRPKQHIQVIAGCQKPTPRRLVQFWDDLQQLPKDVRECMDSWDILKQSGFEIEIFDEFGATEFIRTNLGERYVNAFLKCYHPSMKSDYFRYAYIFVKGGFYVDADDVYHGLAIDYLFEDGRLKLQPFCYDILTDRMVAPSIFTEQGANETNWIFYFNTTPLIAAPNHPIVERALVNATLSLEQASKGELPEVQATTGPGNLTKSVIEIIAELDFAESIFRIVGEWEMISASKWPLSYREDKRNWRLSNQQEYSQPRRS